jgi:hypothetical protein
MKPIINPIDRKLIQAELTGNHLLRRTKSGNHPIYSINANNAPHTMQEIGRLRELTFRHAGGGTGLAVDIDSYDVGEKPFEQLIVWNEEEKEIISSYRFIKGKNAPTDETGYPLTPTSKLFHYSKQFIENQWQESIELGRSFVQPKYQATGRSRQDIFALDNIWDGLGAVIVQNIDTKYFIGKMTLYNHYNREAREYILQFITKHFKGNPQWIYPEEDSSVSSLHQGIPNIFKNTTGDLKEDFKILNQTIQKMNESIPPLIKSYISLSPTMKYYGISPNKSFGEVEELCIMISFSDIYESKKNRYIESFLLK